MKSIISTFALCLFFVTAHAGKVVNPAGEGSIQNPASGAYIKVPIYATIVNEHDFSIISGVRGLNARVYLGEGASASILQALEKIPGWVEKAKEIELDASKDLIRLSDLRLVFVSEAKERKWHLELELHDFDTRRVLIVHLEPEQVPKFTALLRGVPEYFTEFRKQQEKANALE